MANSTKGQGQRRRKQRQLQRKRKRGNASPSSERARVNAKLSQLLKKDHLSYAEVMFLWVAMGGDLFGPKGAAVAAAVAYQENGGNTKGCAGCCCGLWMFNVIPVPSNPCSNTIRTVADAENVFKTTRCTVKYVKANGWGPWEAHPSGGGNYGSYYEHLDKANAILKTAVKGGGGNGTATLLGLPLIPSTGIDIGGIFEDSTDVGEDAVDNFTDRIDMFGDVIDALGDPAFWLRVGKILLGVSLILMGASALSKTLTGFGITDAIPYGKAAKIVGKAGKAAKASKVGGKVT